MSKHPAPHRMPGPSEARKITRGAGWRSGRRTRPAAQVAEPRLPQVQETRENFSRGNRGAPGEQIDDAGVGLGAVDAGADLEILNQTGEMADSGGRKLLAAKVDGQVSCLSAYRAQWFDSREGTWLDAGNGTVQSTSIGVIALPDFPGDLDWGLRLMFTGPAPKP